MCSAQAGMFDQIASPSVPSGAMSPVDTSSGTTTSTRPRISSPSGGTGGGPARGRLADADAGAARRLEHPRAGAEEVGVDAAADDQVEDLARARRHGQVERAR